MPENDPIVNPEGEKQDNWPTPIPVLCEQEPGVPNDPDDGGGYAVARLDQPSPSNTQDTTCESGPGVRGFGNPDLAAIAHAKLVLELVDLLRHPNKVHRLNGKGRGFGVVKYEEQVPPKFGLVCLVTPKLDPGVSDNRIMRAMDTADSNVGKPSKAELDHIQAALEEAAPDWLKGLPDDFSVYEPAADV